MAQHKLDMLRIERDSKLYHWHEDGMSVELLANAAGLTRQGAYDAIERVRPQLDQSQVSDLRKLQAEWEAKVGPLRELQTELEARLGPAAEWIDEVERARAKFEAAAFPPGVKKAQAKFEAMIPPQAAEHLAEVERMRDEAESTMQKVMHEANAAIEQARRGLSTTA
jgi:hypothetical protein